MVSDTHHVQLNKYDSVTCRLGYMLKIQYLDCRVKYNAVDRHMKGVGECQKLFKSVTEFQRIKSIFMKYQKWNSCFSFSLILKTTEEGVDY